MGVLRAGTNCWFPPFFFDAHELIDRMSQQIHNSRAGLTILQLVKQFLQIVAMFVVWYSTLVIFTSGYEYGVVDGVPKRAWMIQLPGYEQYIDLNADPLVMRYVFTTRAEYRVGPWIDPE